MTLYFILKDFKGSQDGRFTESFTAGTQAELSAYLVGCLPADSIRCADEVIPAAVTPAPTSAKSRKQKAV